MNIKTEETSRWEDQLDGESLAFVEELYAQYLRDPELVDDDWRTFFAELPLEVGLHPDQLQGPQKSAAPLFRAGGQSDHSSLAVSQDKVDQLIRAYRVRGHRTAQLDPLGLQSESHPELDVSHYGLTQNDLESEFSTRTLTGAGESLKLSEIIERLQRTYCDHIKVLREHLRKLVHEQMYIV